MVIIIYLQGVDEPEADACDLFILNVLGVNRWRCAALNIFCFRITHSCVLLDLGNFLAISYILVYPRISSRRPRYTLVHKDDKCTCLSIFIILLCVQQHITLLYLLTRAIVCFFMVSQESARSIFAPSSVFPNKIKELLSLKFFLCLLNNFVG